MRPVVRPVARRVVRPVASPVARPAPASSRASASRDQQPGPATPTTLTARSTARCAAGGVGVRDDRGAATVFVVLLATAMLACAGLVIDGGYALAARRASMAQAEQAARVASDKLSQSSLRSGRSALVTGQAQGAARSYLANAGASGSVSITGDQVTVTVRGNYRPAVLSMVGIGSLDVSATATATSIDDDGL